jgi:hypothetical protein
MIGDQRLLAALGRPQDLPVLQPVTVRPIQRPDYILINRRSEQEWIGENYDALKAWHRATGQALGPEAEDACEDFMEFARCQFDQQTIREEADEDADLGYDPSEPWMDEEDDDGV